MAYAYSGRRFMDDSSFRSAPSSPINIAPDIRAPHVPYTSSAYAFNDQLRSDYFGPGVSSFRSAPARMARPYDTGLGARYHTEDMIRRRNLEALTMNRSLHAFGPQHQIHPIICSNGYYPDDFLTPQPVDHLMNMDDQRLEQILTAYGITSHDFYSSRQHPRHMLPRPMLDRAALLEHLGAHPLAEQLISHRPGLMPRSPCATRLPWH